jgi:hypothetical protein
MIAKNPWLRFPDKPPFVLAEDKDQVLAFNAEERFKPNPNLLNINIFPMPFLGRPDAPVVLLGNIAGAGHEDVKDLRPAYADRLRKNLLHQNSDFQFLPLDPDPDTFPHDQKWWQETLKHLLGENYGTGKDAQSVLARSILEVVFFPYRSCSNQYGHDRLSLMSSQGYSRVLVHNAMKNNSVIVMRYGKARWFDAVRGLEKYEHLLLLKGTQKTHISPNGFCDKNGYQKVVNKILANLPS